MLNIVYDEKTDQQDLESCHGEQYSEKCWNIYTDWSPECFLVLKACSMIIPALDLT